VRWRFCEFGCGQVLEVIVDHGAEDKLILSPTSSKYWERKSSVEDNGPTEQQQMKNKLLETI
jgi:hypothetical protein